MDWRFVTALALTGCSFCVVALGGYAVTAAGPFQRKSYTPVPSLSSDATTTTSISGRSSLLDAPANLPRTAKYDDLEPSQTNSAARHEAADLSHIWESTTVVAALSPTAAEPESGPAHYGKMPEPPRNNSQISEVRNDVAVSTSGAIKGKSNQPLYCPLLDPAPSERRGQQIAIRHGLGEERATAKFALVLGVGF